MLSCSETLPLSSLSISITERADGYSGKGLFVHAYYLQDLMATVVVAQTFIALHRSSNGKVIQTCFPEDERLE